MLGSLAQILTTLLSICIVLKSNVQKSILKKIYNFIINFHSLVLLFWEDKNAQFYIQDINSLPIQTQSYNSTVEETVDTEKQMLSQVEQVSPSQLYYSPYIYDSLPYKNLQDYNLQTMNDQYSNKVNPGECNKILEKEAYQQGNALNNYTGLYQSNQKKNVSNVQGNKQANNNYNTNIINGNGNNAIYKPSVLKGTDQLLQGYNNLNFVLMNNKQLRKKYINPNFIQNQDKLLKNCHSLKCTCLKQKRMKKKQNFHPTSLSVIFEEVAYC